MAGRRRLALEVFRRARSSADWHRLPDLCGSADVVIVDEQAVYSPRDFNDRFLLGHKGAMNEAELYWMPAPPGRQAHKARRGERFFVPPVGHQWDAATRSFRLDPEQVQRAVRLVFARFRLDCSACGASRDFAQRSLQMLSRSINTCQLRWVPPAPADAHLSLLHNPVYAGGLRVRPP